MKLSTFGMARVAALLNAGLTQAQIMFSIRSAGPSRYDKPRLKPPGRSYPRHGEHECARLRVENGLLRGEVTP